MVFKHKVKRNFRLMKQKKQGYEKSLLLRIKELANS